MKNSSRWIINFIGTILLLGMFAVGALILMNVGVRVYNNVVTTNNNNFTLRTSLNYIATKVRSCDVRNAVEIVNFGDGNALCLTDESADGVYRTYIYMYNGKLCEVIESDGHPVEPDYGFDILEISKFNVTESDGKISLYIENIAGGNEMLTLSLRSHEGRGEAK